MKFSLPNLPHVPLKIKYIIITVCVFCMGLLLLRMSLKAGARELKHSSTKANEANYPQHKKQNTKFLKLSSGHFGETRTISEWRAFAIYHPTSGVSEDSLFNSFKTRSPQAENTAEQNSDTPNENIAIQILGARSLIPILRSAFGDQVRGFAAAERDPYFLNHPEALFNPTQLKALCDRDIENTADEGSDVCWKPRLTEEYLSALTDFASDACPHLVSKESKHPIKMQNKLIRTNDFREQNIKTFATLSLRIPIEKVTDEWVMMIVGESKRNAGEDEGTPTNSEDNQLRMEDLYSMACQAILLSQEFYTR